MLKWEYIKKISEKDDKYGSLLIELMDKYNKTNLNEISEEEVKEFIKDLNSKTSD